jgi:hypothetical protein
MALGKDYPLLVQECTPFVQLNGAVGIYKHEFSP